MARWQGAEEPEFERLNWRQRVRLCWRAMILVVATLILLPSFWLAKLIEKVAPNLGMSRFIIWFWCAMGVWLCGLRLETSGTPMAQGGARVANHASWADVFVMRAASQIYFVAKAEVRSWPLMGMIGAHTGTVFIERNPRKAQEQKEMFLARLRKGDRLCFFPEGTSSDGRRVLPFKSTLFSAFMEPELAELMWVQPVSVSYRPQTGLAQNFFGWWGEMPFGAHIAQVFGRSVHSRVHVHFHEPVKATDFEDRKALARYCEERVREGHAAHVRDDA
jgi:1-acyl-sn-glycerol-3-phosphate acyltransferase